MPGPQPIVDENGNVVGFGEALPLGQNPPELPMGQLPPTQEELEADAARAEAENAPSSNLVARPATVTGPNGKPLQVEAGQGPVNNELFSQGLGLPDGVHPDEPRTMLEVGQTPPVLINPREARWSEGANRALEAQTQEGFGGATSERSGRGNGQPPAPTTPEEVAAAEAAVEAARIEEEKKSGRMSDEEYSNLQAWYGVQQDRGVALEQQVPGEVETANRAAALQDEYTAQLRQNADNILDSMEQARARQEQAQEEMRVKSEALFSRGFNARSIYQSPDRAANIGVSLGIAVGAMLQQFNNSLHPGQNAGNAALQMVEQAQEADIAQQREMFRRGQLGLESDNAAMTAMRELGADEVTAFEFARHQAGENLASQLEALATAHAGTRLAADLTDRAAVIRQQAMDRRLRIEMQMAQLAARRVRRGRRPEPTTRVMNRARFRFSNSTDPIVVAAQSSYDSLSEAQQITHTEAMDAHQGVRELLHQLNNMISRDEISGGLTIDFANRARARNIMGNITTQFSNSNNLGSMDEGLQDLMKSMMGDPAAMASSADSLRASISSQMNIETGQLDTLTDRYGFERIPGFRRDRSTDQMVEGRETVADNDPRTPIQDERSAAPPSVTLATPTVETRALVNPRGIAAAMRGSR